MNECRMQGCILYRMNRILPRAQQTVEKMSGRFFMSAYLVCKPEHSFSCALDFGVCSDVDILVHS